MKPIQLTIAGLQSYREKQEIDFTRLCDAGVFGIFGPTGSGKSTILDAITLALYGRVERASGGTQGILHHAENTLSVSFTFSLTGADGTHTYRVERQFKRSGDISITGTVTRLVRMHGADGQVVLADKAAEVNAKVLEVLGLSMADFTRAVVLPQGKFAEFLSLKGVDRRQMLQRLFHLEAYGDQLNQRISLQYKEIDVAIKEIAAEKQGLGDASVEALDAARDRLRELTEAAAQRRKDLEEAGRKWEQLRQLRVWQAERDGYARELQELQIQEADMAELEHTVQQAERAERVRPFLEKWEGDLRQAQSAQTELEQASAAHSNAGHAFAEAQIRYETAKRELDAEDAPLQIRIQQLTEAIEALAEAELTRETIRRLKSEHAGVFRELEAAREELRKEQEKHAKAVQLQAQLKQEVESGTVKPEERQRLQAAARDKARLTALEEKHIRLGRELTAAEERLRAAEAEAAKQVDGQQALGGEQQVLLARWAELAAGLAALEHVAAEQVQQGTELAERSLLEQQAASRQRLAAELAHSLAAGEPCPVCGSPHHPQPAAPAAGTGQAAAPAPGAAAAARAPAAASALAARLAPLGVAAAGVRRTLRGHSAAVEPGPALAEAAAAADAAAPAASGTAPALSAVELAHALEALGARIGAAERSWAALDADARAHEHARQQLAQRQAVAAAQLSAHAPAAAGLLEQQAAAGQELHECRAAWAARYGGLQPEQLEEQLAASEEADRKTETLRNRINNGEQFIETSALRQQALQQTTAEADKLAARLEAEWDALAKAQEEKDRRLADRFGDTPITTQLNQSQGRLTLVRENEQRERHTTEQMKSSLQAAAERIAGVKRADELSRLAATSSETQLKTVLLEAVFPDPDTVKRSLRPQPAVETWKQDIRAYRERELLVRGRLEQAERQLDGRYISDEEWQAAETQLQTARQNDEEALESRARAGRDVEELELKHRHWKELELQKASLQEKHTRLSRLQTVFRGNTFVEFLAEEQLMQVSRSASERLSQLTRGRYALEVDSGGGFVIRDDANGGIRRPVATLSGGETFLTSLALALALSAQIQLSGQYPLEFFFLDEGFGTLDPDLLDTVVTALERLHLDKLTVGVISHVPELRARLLRRLTVLPAEPNGRGSRVVLESL